MSTNKKRVNRKYQFDPIAHSPLFPVISEQVRLHVLAKRKKLYNENEWKRASRRLLFESLFEMERNFVPPQTYDENNTRTVSINRQIAIKTEMRSSLESLNCLMEWMRSQYKDENLSRHERLLELREEQREEKNNAEVLRHLRKIVFLQKLSKESKTEMERRKMCAHDAEMGRKKISAGEREEEETLMFPSDRKLAACGLITQPTKISTGHNM
ncbi:hypothetical protein BEWA_011200 [Theileria equi strain WA]|uniref:Uncharacterized protein n=1 Tax=Theileria equi strain WA TaxID=1537102 RepID=L0B1F7_THEEQ|nr:hypothetical protein BEWA_011200 [Theileria equi strain WA]AFZ81702.1 hypothetical protein BEWA_011200 [Theileria equi strain WA]|eukprot:XP_004831368.1 hypothetical protein BEWA_011200 [Theileria equi strain WA]